ncbi:LOW QUALITY PROTEIN: hypothetical protein OSB04_024021 [Centaurea solstitialis]|uniref:Uncharacterized protein n=1 Tax=Centaurea solstitialis TaxID=347529 RepID=A0AA38SM05_9ASTR|nr:LOW QUALITY PROTEIN: hypothetical protein OSB04_024021 [Centaurea solstitialis]
MIDLKIETDLAVRNMEAKVCSRGGTEDAATLTSKHSQMPYLRERRAGDCLRAKYMERRTLPMPIRVLKLVVYGEREQTKKALCSVAMRRRHLSRDCTGYLAYALSNQLRGSVVSEPSGVLSGDLSGFRPVDMLRLAFGSGVVSSLVLVELAPAERSESDAGCEFLARLSGLAAAQLLLVDC